ncbi:MAG: cyclodeaminase/cyclohydrolase family protein [Chloroflexota bacterium]
MSESSERVADMTLGDFSEALASERPTPGGGGASALAATFAAALTSMVVRLSLDRPAYQQHAALHAEALADSDAARLRFLDLADEDAAAYTAYLQARRLPHEDKEEESARAAATRDAARLAATVPLTIVQECHGQIDIVERVAGRTNVNAASDLDVAAMLLESAAKGAAANAAVNLAAIEDVGFADAVLAELDQRLRQIQNSTARTRERVHAGSKRRPEST